MPSSSPRTPFEVRPTHTFAGANIGAAAASRFVVISTHVEGRTIASCTTDGNAATSLANTNSSDSPTRIWGLFLPSGATADIVIGLSGSGFMVAGVWAVYDLLSTTR